MTTQFSGSPSAYGLTPATSTLLAGAADEVAQTRWFMEKMYSQYPDYTILMNGVYSDIVQGGGTVGLRTDTLNVFHQEQPSLLQSVVVNAIDSGGTGSTPAILTIEPDGPNNSLYTNYAAPEQIFQIARNQQRLLVQAVTLPTDTGGSTHKITVSALNGQAVVDILNAGDILNPVTTGTTDDATFGTGGYVTSWMRYGIEWQDLKTESAPLGIADYYQKYEFNVSPDGSGPRILAPIFTSQTMMRNTFNIVGAALTGSGNYFTNASGALVQETMGLKTTTVTYGSSEDYAIGAFQQADWFDMQEQMDGTGAGQNLKVLAGPTWLQYTQANIEGMFVNGALQYISGPEWNQGTRSELKTNNLGRYNIGKWRYGLIEASEYRHKEMFSPLNSDNVNSTAYWTNVFHVIPDGEYAIQKEMTNYTTRTDAPMFRILQTAQPNTMNGTSVLTNVFYQNPENLGQLKYRMIIFQKIAVQMILPIHTFFGGAILA